MRLVQYGTWVRRLVPSRMYSKPEKTFDGWYWENFQRCEKLISRNGVPANVGHSVGKLFGSAFSDVKSFASKLLGARSPYSKGTRV